MNILAGDIGGTNTRLIFAATGGQGYQVIAEQSYVSAEFDGLLPVIDCFLAQHNLTAAVDAACFAIAGPVEFGIAKVTNLPWVIRQQELSDMLQTPRVKLINDLAAAAYGISDLAEADILLMQQGQLQETDKVNPDAVIVAAGTGLGASHMVWLGDRYHVFSSESGHGGFAPENTEQTELLTWMQTKHSHVSLELLLSGRGLVTIYRFLREVKGLPESMVVDQTILKIDPAQAITEHALLGNDLLCRRALEIFIDIYGAAAGNIVLQHYPVGALYIAGGIAPKIKDKMLDGRFIEAFRNKGLMSANMKKVSVKLVLQEKTGLYGALAQARALTIQAARAQ